MRYLVARGVFEEIAPQVSRLLAAHIRWGSTIQGQGGEIAALADWILARSKEAYFGGPDIVVIGDVACGERRDQARSANTSLVQAAVTARSSQRSS